MTFAAGGLRFTIHDVYSRWHVPPFLQQVLYETRCWLCSAAGAPCGVMDQMTAALGEADRLLALRCQPAEVQGCAPIPPHLRFWGVDSGEQGL